MRIMGVVAEYNPFHNGHVYQIDHAKKDLIADGVVVVMSGNFVQRGSVAIMDKRARAAAAIRGGVFYFSGRSNDDRIRERHEILHTTREQLMDFSHTLDAVCKTSGVCVIGGRDVIDACTELETVEPLQ